MLTIRLDRTSGTDILDKYTGYLNVFFVSPNNYHAQPSGDCSSDNDIHRRRPFYLVTTTKGEKPIACDWVFGRGCYKNYIKCFKCTKLGCSVNFLVAYWMLDPVSSPNPFWAEKRHIASQCTMRFKEADLKYTICILHMCVAFRYLLHPRHPSFSNANYYSRSPGWITSAVVMFEKLLLEYLRVSDVVVFGTAWRSIASGHRPLFMSGVGQLLRELWIPLTSTRYQRSLLKCI